jgi:hypothetical protein
MVSGVSFLSTAAITTEDRLLKKKKDTQSELCHLFTDT